MKMEVKMKLTDAATNIKIKKTRVEMSIFTMELVSEANLFPPLLAIADRHCDILRYHRTQGETSFSCV